MKHKKKKNKPVREVEPVPGDIVVIPFAGTDSGGEVALKNGRKFAGVGGRQSFLSRLADGMLNRVNEARARIGLPLV